MSSHLEAAIAPEADAAPANGGLTSVYVITVILAACSILYELLAAQTMSLLSANTVVWYSLVVGTFLAAMGLGSYWSRRLGRKSLWTSLFRIEIALTLVGALIVPLLHLAHTTYLHLMLSGAPGDGAHVLYVTAAIVVVAVGVLTGIELPLLMRIAREMRNENAVANTVLGLDYIGALIGALMFPLLLLPSLDMLAIGMAIAAANLAVAAWVLLAREREDRWRDKILLLVISPLLVAGVVNIPWAKQYFLRRYYYYLELTNTWAGRFEPRPEFPEVLRRSSPYQKIDLVRDIAPDYSAHIMPAYSTKLEKYPSYPVDYILCLNGDFQTNTRYDELYHEWFGHVPIIVSGEIPQRVLLLGGGDGFLLRELLKYEAIERITHVDIDPELISLAKTHDALRAANGDSFRDPRVDTTIGDGYQYVRRSKEQFDAIYIDFPVPNNYDLAKLYSREFFHFVRKRIAPGGFAVFDSTGTSYLTSWSKEGKRWPTPDNDWPIYYHTLRKAGFETIVPFMTTLERDNAQARAILDKMEFGLDLEARLQQFTDPAERERQRELARASVIDQLIERHIISVEQGFTMVSPDAKEYSLEYEDPGVELHVLNEHRFRLAFAVDFPMPPDIDPSKVNSILRPTLPTTPWWKPRQPF